MQHPPTMPQPSWTDGSLGGAFIGADERKGICLLGEVFINLNASSSKGIETVSPVMKAKISLRKCDVSKTVIVTSFQGLP